MSAAIFSVGVDLGGTWIRLEAVDAHKRHIRSLKSAAMPVKKLPAFLKKKLAAWKTKPQRLTVASRGVWSTPERRLLQRALRPLAAHVVVMSDVEAAWHAAFTTQGVIVIAGTGSIAYGRTARGKYARAGGLGPIKGDEGSAFWIGKEWLKRSRGQQAKPSHGAIRRVAALTPRILQQARQGDPIAKGIFIEAENHLAALALSISQRLHFGKTIPVSWAGGLLNNSAFRAGFAAALRRSGKRFQLRAPSRTPVAAVARLFDL